MSNRVGKILGLTPVRFIIRVTKTILITSVIFFLAFYIPNLIISSLGIPLGDFQPIYLSFTIVLMSLSIFAQVFRGHPLGIFASVALSLAAAIYLVTITNGGFLAVTAMGLEITLEFPIILYLFVISASFGVVTNIWSSIHRSGADPLGNLEEEIQG
ncbi:MAG: hypothetical protein V3U49_02240 [Nitrososphaerales archaeon]